jgi:hypothetical protein
MQAGELIARSLGENFYGAIGIVTDPARDSQDVSFALDEPAEADALDAAADEKATGLNGRFFSGNHEVDCRSQKSDCRSKILRFQRPIPRLVSF